MNSKYSAQDVLQCHLCETPVPTMYCDICHVKLCKACVGEHLSDGSKDHKVVPYDKRGSTFKCPKHSAKICELHCEDCNILVCILCVSTGDHFRHDVVEISKSLTRKKETIQSDLQELENVIYRNYNEAISKIPTQRAELKESFKKLTTALNKQGEAFHAEIDRIILKMQSEIDNMEGQCISALKQQEDRINHNINEISQIIFNMQKLLNTSDICLISMYKNRNEEFRRLPAEIQATLPNFIPQEINSEKIYQQIGYLSELVITTEEKDDQVQNPDAVPAPTPISFIDEPLVIADVKTEFKELCSVASLSVNELVTCGASKHLKLYNIQGKLLRCIQTLSQNWPHDIAVLENMDLAYTDPKERSINIVSFTQKQSVIPLLGWGSKPQIQPLIKLKDWIPFYVCRTSLGDLLVIMDSDDRKQTKLVRYSGSKEKQSIQWDGQGNPLYSSGGTKYLSENRNLDICVADRDARAVVVVSAAGKLRFRYTGHTSGSKDLFQPVGITTDSKGLILTADYNMHNPIVHILDQDGKFLRYIINCDLRTPMGLCQDSTDNLLVADFKTGRVTTIQYYK